MSSHDPTPYLDPLTLVDGISPPVADEQTWRTTGIVMHRRHRDVDVTVANNTDATFNWATVTPKRTDRDDIQWVPVSQDGPFFVVHIGGLYLVAVSTAWESNATGQRGTRLLRNGTVVTIGNVPARGTVGAETTYHDLLDPGDVIETTVFQNSGGPLNVLANDRTWIQVTRLTVA